MNVPKRWIWTFSLIFWICHAGMQTAHQTALLSLEGQSFDWGSVALRPLSESAFWFLMTPLLWLWAFCYGLKPQLSLVHNGFRALMLLLGGVLLTYSINVLVVGVIFLVKNLPISTFDPFSRRWGLHLAREPIPWLFLFVMTLLHILVWVNQFSSQKLDLVEAKLKWERLQKRNLLWVLQPHLIFNSLQNLMIGSQVRETDKEPLGTLADYLHCVFEGSQEQEVTLEKELSFLGTFLRLASSSERVEMNNEAELKWLIPAFALQCLVENALKFGDGQVTVCCSVRGEQLVVEVTNLRHSTEQKPGWGMGLQNLKDRIQLLYGNQSSFFLTIHESFARACLAVPLKEVG